MGKFLEFIKEQNSLKALAKKKLLLEGGADGHMHHIWETDGITFSELREIFKELFTGQLSITEKCLAPETKVVMEKSGECEIQNVVNNKLNERVLAYNEEKNEAEFVKIEDFVQNSQTDDWLEIELENGQKIICTPNHRIFQNGQDIQAKDLHIGDDLIINE